MGVLDLLLSQSAASYFLMFESRVHHFKLTIISHWQLCWCESMLQKQKTEELHTRPSFINKKKHNIEQQELTLQVFQVSLELPYVADCASSSTNFQQSAT